VFFLVVCVSTGLSPLSSVGGIKLAPGCVAGVAIWVCWVNLVIHQSALHAAGPTLFEG
jgi:hypothetical protein